MREPDKFDAFYKDARERLLLQTYALTGDLTASTRAVRDTFVTAWHQWRRVGRLEDPEAWVRPRAWSHAQHRHAARLLHRDRTEDDGVRATLDALASLPIDQRRVLLLTHTVAMPMADLAREAALPVADAERALQTATAQFSLARDVPSTGIRALLEPLAATAADVGWPRPSIVRRAGTRRRRTHTALGAAAAVTALLVSGSLVSDVGGVRPSLARETLSSPDVDRPAAPAAPVAPEPGLTAGDLLTATQVSRQVDGNAWIVARTDDNVEGNGLVLRCQQERYADPRGAEALVRRFVTDPARAKDPVVSAVQSAEASRSEQRARRTYRRLLGWFAGCTAPRVQLQSTRRVGGVGDQGALFVLRRWKDPVETIVVGVARTGELTTTTATTTTSTERPPFARAAQLLADAVDGLCGLPGAGACASTPALRQIPPLPVGSTPALLGAYDLPPVTGVAKAWVGTQPAPATTNAASTQCDDTGFDAPAMTGNLTRSFLIPGAKLPSEFGLTESVATLPRARAQALVQTVRGKLDSCSDDQLGTEVEQIQQVRSERRDLTVWRVTTEITENRSVRYLMAILRSGGAVAQLGFVPSGDVDMEGDAFVDLSYRALDRLAQQRGPAAG